MSQPIKKIALEEHFMAPGFQDYFETTAVNISPELFGKAFDALQDFEGRRIEAMDESGVDLSILSLAGPGVQAERNTAIAVDKAKRCNDFLADKMSAQPRFGGLAHLAMQDPLEAANELERCVKDLNFQGAMINGSTNGAYLDDDRFSVFWERAEALSAPIYIHPNNSPDTPYMYHDHPELYGPVWSWTVETGNHALRIVFGGVFDRYPKAKLILGHMGETLPYQLWRFDSRWEICNAKGRTLKQKPSDYIKNNIWITTSGVCSNEPLRCAIEAVGDDRILFSGDYPFESAKFASDWIEGANISDASKEKICFSNAKSLLNIK